MRRLTEQQTTVEAPSLNLGRRQFLGWGGLLGGVMACQPFGEVFAAATTPPPSRIISIGGALTEMIYALGAAQQLAGVDTTSLYPVMATKLPSVGYARTLSAEGILSLAPDLIIATEDAGPPEVIRKLQAANIRISILPANHRFEGMLKRLQQVGELVGKRHLALQQSRQLQQAWLEAKQGLPRANNAKFKALFILSHGPSQIMVGGKDTSADAMMTYLGVRNCMTTITGYKPLTTEAVIAAQPDVLLFTSQGLAAIGGIEGALKLPGIDQTPAGKQRRIVAQEAMLMLGFGPRLPQGLQQLNAALQQSLRT